MASIFHLTPIANYPHRFTHAALSLATSQPAEITALPDTITKNATSCLSRPDGDGPIPSPY